MMKETPASGSTLLPSTQMPHRLNLANIRSIKSEESLRIRSFSTKELHTLGRRSSSPTSLCYSSVADYQNDATIHMDGAHASSHEYVLNLDTALTQSSAATCLVPTTLGTALHEKIEEASVSSDINGSFLVEPSVMPSSVSSDSMTHYGRGDCLELLHASNESNAFDKSFDIGSSNETSCLSNGTRPLQNSNGINGLASCNLAPSSTIQRCAPSEREKVKSPFPVANDSLSPNVVIALFREKPAVSPKWKRNSISSLKVINSSLIREAEEMPSAAHFDDKRQPVKLCSHPYASTETICKAFLPFQRSLSFPLNPSSQNMMVKGCCCSEHCHYFDTSSILESISSAKLSAVQTISEDSVAPAFTASERATSLGIVKDTAVPKWIKTHDPLRIFYTEKKPVRNEKSEHEEAAIVAYQGSLDKSKVMNDSTLEDRLPESNTTAKSCAVCYSQKHKRDNTLDKCLAKVHPEVYLDESLLDTVIEYVSKMDGSLLKYYSINALIEIGSFSQIYRCKEKNTDRHFAVKVIPKRTVRLLHPDPRQMYHLFTFFRDHLHPNIVRLHRFLEDDSSFFIVMDYCEGPTVFDYFMSCLPGSISERQVKEIVQQLLRALDLLHVHNLVHGDVKFENLMFKEDFSTSVFQKNLIPGYGARDYSVWSNLHYGENLKLPPICLIDVDAAKDVNSFYRKDVLDEITRGSESWKSKYIPQFCFESNIVGSIPYMSPESYDGFLCTASDMWSCGVLLYTLLDGNFPFELHEDTPSEIRKNILKHQEPYFDPVVWANYSLAANLCLRLLDPNPMTRIQSAREALIHQWFSSSEMHVSFCG